MGSSSSSSSSPSSSAAQIPKLARSLGSAQSEFKKGLADGAKDDPKRTVVAEVTPHGRGARSGAGPRPAGRQTPRRRTGPTGTRFLIRS